MTVTARMRALTVFSISIIYNSNQATVHKSLLVVHTIYLAESLFISVKVITYKDLTYYSCLIGSDCFTNVTEKFGYLELNLGK